AEAAAEAISNGLSQVPELSTKAKSETDRFKGTTEKPSDVGKKLGVEGIVSGEVTVKNTYFTISVELVSVANGIKLFGGKYPGEVSPEGVVKVQQDITRDLAAKLGRPVPKEVLEGMIGSVDVGKFTAEIYGVVYDASSKPVPGAEVKLTHQPKAFTRTALTDEEGNYRFARVPPGEGYQIEASNQGIKSDARPGLPALPGQDRRVFPPLLLKAQ
ncbi:MAG: carboxypeptidase regulatory-like domain-containing protein, partial [Terriglobales bacterium]